MKRRIFIICILLVFVVLLFIMFKKAHNNFSFFYRNEIKSGKELIQRIEDYRAKNGVLPGKLNELYSEAEKERYEIYYYDIEGQDYVLYFGTTLGEGVYYYSKYDEWCDYLKY